MTSGVMRLLRSLSSRLILAFVVIIIVTTLAAGIPAYLFARNELELQVLARLEDGSRITQTLLHVEEDRLANLAALTAERPTLRAIIEEGDLKALDEYLNTFRASVELDFLIVRDAEGTVLVESQLLSPWPEPPFPKNIAYFSYTEIQRSVVLLASQPLYIEGSGDIMGYVTLGNLLDDEFTSQLAEITGFEQSILIGSSRIATSLGEGAKYMEEAVSPPEGLKEGAYTATTIDDGSYYTSLVPITDEDEDDHAIAYIEVALPIDNLITAERRALLTMAVSTVLVIIVGSLLGSLIARRLTHPLSLLTAAASKGDIDSPYPMPREPEEIATLAVALEKSRTNIKRSLEDLEQAKAWSETLIHSIIEGIVTFDDQGHITSFNQGAEHIIGCSQDDVLQKSLDEIFHLPEGEGKFSEQIPSSGGRRQIPVITRTGKQITLAVTGAHLIPPDGDITQSALVLRDITEEEAARNLRSYFLANISHEFRTPLSAINASVELLLEELEDLSTAEIGELLNSIHMSVSGLQTLIDNLLESLSIEAGRFQIRRRPTEINIVILEAIALMKPLLSRRQQKLLMHNPPQLPKINLDPTRLTQVVTNLLSNASKYSPIEKDIDLIVEMLNDDQLKISIADRGPGILPVDRSDIFRRFVRLDSQDGIQYGIGLGLSVVKAIVEEHGGVVGVEDRPGGGSIFWFTLPITGATT